MKPSTSDPNHLGHHYFILDAEVILDVCQNKIGGLKHAIDALLDEYPGD